MANKFLPPNFHVDAPVIEIDGVCWIYKQPSAETPTVQELDGVYQTCEQCLASPSPVPSPIVSPSPSPLQPSPLQPSPSPLPAAPCACPSGLDDQYRIKDYVDGLIPACVTCESLTGDTVWTGLFERFDELCWWGRPETHNQMDSVRLGQAFLLLDNFSPPNCVWSVEIECSNVDLVTYDTIWYGTKATGDTPEGVYTKIGGCGSGPAQLTVEALP